MPAAELAGADSSDAQTIQQNDNIRWRASGCSSPPSVKKRPENRAFSRNRRNQLLANAIATSPTRTHGTHMREVGKASFPRRCSMSAGIRPSQSRLAGVYGGLVRRRRSGFGAGAGSAGGGRRALSRRHRRLRQPVRPDHAGSAGRLPEQTFHAHRRWNRLAMKPLGKPCGRRCTLRHPDHGSALAGTSPIKATSLYNKIQPILNYLQGRVAMDSADSGAQGCASFRELGNSLFAVDLHWHRAKLPARANTRPVAPISRATRSSSIQNTGLRTGGKRRRVRLRHLCRSHDAGGKHHGRPHRQNPNQRHRQMASSPTRPGWTRSRPPGPSWPKT